MRYLGVDVIVNQTGKSLVWADEEGNYYGQVIAEDTFISEIFGPRDTQAEIEWLIRTWQLGQKRPVAQTESRYTQLLDWLVAFPLLKRVFHFYY